MSLTDICIFGSRPSKIGIVPCLGGMLDVEDHDFIGPFVISVIDQIRISLGDAFADVFGGLSATRSRKEQQVLQALINAACTRTAADGLRAVRKSATAAMLSVARGVNRSFIARSGETQPRLPRQWQTRDAWPVPDFLARRKGAPDRSARVRRRWRQNAASPARSRPGSRAATGARPQALFPEASSWQKNKPDSVAAEEVPTAGRSRRC